MDSFQQCDVTYVAGSKLPIIRIPIKGGMTIPNIATFDHGTYVAAANRTWFLFPPTAAIFFFGCLLMELAEAASVSLGLCCWSLWRRSWSPCRREPWPSRSQLEKVASDWCGKTRFSCWLIWGGYGKSWWCAASAKHDDDYEEEEEEGGGRRGRRRWRRKRWWWRRRRWFNVIIMIIYIALRTLIRILLQIWS